MNVAEILAALAPMFAEAEIKGRWFYSPYINASFSPAELRAEIEAGRCVWGPSNWRLVSPAEAMTVALRNELEARRYVEKLRERISAWRVTLPGGAYVG